MRRSAISQILVNTKYYTSPVADLITNSASSNLIKIRQFHLLEIPPTLVPMPMSPLRNLHSSNDPILMLRPTTPLSIRRFAYPRKIFRVACSTVILPIALALPALAGSLADALDAPALIWTTGGDASWLAQTVESNDAVDAVQSGLISHSDESWLETTVTGPGVLSFSWKVSSEGGPDRLAFYLDGDTEDIISGEVDWESQTYNIQPRTHTLRWRYSKDSSVVKGDDAGWVDQVNFVLDGPVTTGAASAVAVTSAELNGVVNPSGLATTAIFEYGLTTAYGSSAAVTLLPANGTVHQQVSVVLSGLAAETTYHYRLVASNSSNPDPGVDKSFTTKSLFAYDVHVGEVTITGYNGSNVNLIIPATLNGLPVTCIGDYAFGENEDLVSVVVPNSVTVIENSAFYECYNLMTITLPIGLTSIGSEAFSDCENLKTLTIPSSVTSIGSRAFSSCIKLTSLILPGGITAISSSLFYNCRGLTSLVIPANVTSIGSYAFSSCSSLIGMIIPNTVTSIGDGAFSSCGKLASATLSNTITSLGDELFSGCGSLLGLTIPSGVQSIGNEAFLGCSSLTNLTIPTGVTRIEESTFQGCSKLASITLPTGITSLGESAFSGCGALTSMVIPNGVTSISGELFSGCSSLFSVTIPSGVTFIGHKAFFNCGSLLGITIPASVTEIEEYAFAGCEALTGLTIPESVISIGRDTFYECDDLAFITVDALNTAYSSQSGVIFNKAKTTLIKCPGAIAGSYGIPATVTSISANAFASCESLTNVTIPNSVISIGNNAFGYCSGLLNVTLPTGLTLIASDLFSGCSSLTAVVIPNNVTEIGSSAFSGCSNLLSATLPTSLESIESSAFKNCGKLQAITIPVNTVSIGYEAFRDCSSLTTVSIPRNVEEIDDDAFSGCSSLTAIHVDVLNADYSSHLGVLCNKSQSYLIAMPTGFVGGYVILASVTEIKPSAFRNCRRLTGVTIPGNVGTIPSSAFRNCSSLVNVTISNGTTGIGNYAFAYCKNLNRVNIPDSVNQIGEWAFSGCVSLTTVTIPRNVYGIEDGAFAGSGLTRAYFSGDAPDMGDDVFESVGNGFTSYFLNDREGFEFWNSGEFGVVVGINSFVPEISVENAVGVTLSDSGSSVSLGATPVNVALSQVFTIKNIGHSELTGLTITKDGTHATDFTITVNPATLIPGPAGSTTFTVSFKPTAAGVRSAAIHIASNDTDESSFDIMLTGSGTVPEIAVTQGVALTDAKSTINFGKVKLKASMVKSFTITNQGNAPLSGLSIIKSGANAAEFTVAALGATTLAGGASTTFKVTFKATIAGTRRAAIKIISNDADENPFDIALTGVAVIAAAPPRASLVHYGSPSTKVGSLSDYGTIGYDLIDGLKYLTLTVDKSSWGSPRLPVVEVSSNLLDWFSGNTHTETVSDNNRTLKVRDKTPTTPSDKRHIHLKDN